MQFDGPALAALGPLPRLAVVELSQLAGGAPGPELAGGDVADGLLAPSKGHHPYPVGALGTLRACGCPEHVDLWAGCSRPRT